MADEDAAGESGDRAPSGRSTPSERGRRDRRFRRHESRGPSPCARRGRTETIERFAQARRPCRSPRPAVCDPCASTIASTSAICASSNAKSTAKQRRSLQLDAAAPALARLGEDRPADRASAGRRCRYGCGSRACRAHRRSAGRTPCARATSRALQLAARSAATVSSALGEGRRSDWARAARYGPCRDGCARRRTAAGRSRPASARRGSCRQRMSPPLGAIARDAPALDRAMSTRAKPSRSIARRVEDRARAAGLARPRGHSAARRRSAKSRSSRLASARAVVPAAQQQMRERGEQRDRSRCRSTEISSSAANMRGMLSRKPNSTMR